MYLVMLLLCAGASPVYAQEINSGAFQDAAAPAVPSLREATFHDDHPDSLWNGILIGGAVTFIISVVGVGYAGGGGEMDPGDWAGAVLVIGGFGGMIGAMIDAAIPWDD